VTFILLIREIRVRLFCVINTYLRHLCAVIGIRVIREIRVRNRPPQTWLYFKFQLSSVFHGSLMAPALACIILHIEPPIYQPFSQNNVGMQAKKRFIFSYFKITSARPQSALISMFFTTIVPHVKWNNSEHFYLILLH